MDSTTRRHVAASLRSAAHTLTAGPNDTIAETIEEALHTWLFNLSGDGALSKFKWKIKGSFMSAQKKTDREGHTYWTNVSVEVSLDPKPVMDVSVTAGIDVSGYFSEQRRLDKNITQRNAQAFIEKMLGEAEEVVPHS